MVKTRAVETNIGIVGDEAVRAYDASMRYLRDKGQLQTDSILKARIDMGRALEIGPGPGYEGLEWLKRTEDTTLKGLDISGEMIAMAIKNAKDYDLSGRAEYFYGDACCIPFKNGHFDAVFSINSLHEWESPIPTFNEIHRVLCPGGRYFISDLRRDMNPMAKWFIRLSQPAKSKKMQSGFVSSVNASYTLPELQTMLKESRLQECSVEQNLIHIIISGRKPYNTD